MDRRESKTDDAVARLKADTSQLACDANGRRPGSSGHVRAQDYLESRMCELGLRPLFAGGYRQPSPDPEGFRGVNLCGELPGSGDRTILVGAHYDTHEDAGPGADDNAAAVAIALEVARVLHPWRGDASVVFAFFDQEEPPYFLTHEMGSMAFVRRAPIDLARLDCALVMDLCGHDLPEEACPEALVVMGAEHRQALLDVVVDAERPDQPLITVPHRIAPDLSDHYSFRQAGIPFLFLTCGWWAHYHQATDTLDRLNPVKMGRIAGALERLVRTLDQLPAGATQSSEAARNFDGIAARGFERLTGRTAPDNPEEMYRRIQARALSWARMGWGPP